METNELYDRLTLFDQLKVDVMALGGTIFESTQDVEKLGC